MTIRNKEQFMASLWDWGILKGCFGDTNISPTDVDGLVERNGQFLLLEAKSPGTEIPKGQDILFKRLVEVDRWTVLVIWGKPGKPEKIRVITHYGDSIMPEANLFLLRAMVSDWFREAESQDRPVYRRR